MGTLTNLQRAYVPNNPVLNKIVKWFDAVSAFIDSFSSTNAALKAEAYVTVNNFGQQYGFTAPLTHVSAGLYEAFYATPIDNIANYIVLGNLANMTVSDTVLYDIGFQLVDTTRVRIRVYSLADTAGVTAPVPADHDFFIRVERLPGV